MGFERIQNDPDMMAALQKMGPPWNRLPIQDADGPQPGVYDWLNQIAHGLGGALQMRGGVGGIPAITRNLRRPVVTPAGISEPGLVDRIGKMIPREGPPSMPPPGAPGALDSLRTQVGDVSRVAERAPRAATFTADQLSEVLSRVRSGVVGAREELGTMLNSTIGKISGAFAKRLKSGAMDKEDLMQEGHELLGKVSTHPNYDLSKSFLPYISQALRSHYQELVRKSSNLPLTQEESRLISKLNSINKLSAKMSGRLRTTDELSKMTGVSPEKIDSVYRGVEAQQSLNPPRGMMADPVEKAAGTPEMWQRLWGGD